MGDLSGRSGWSRFWNTGRWWKAVLLAVVYFALYQLLSFSVLPVVSLAGEPGSASFVLIYYAVPVFLGCVVLAGFGASVGWLRGLLRRETNRGGGWMWIAVAIVLVFNILHMLSIDYDAAGIDYVLTWMLTGLFIGFAEEVLTRGYVVRIMRNAGHRELVVALVSAALFALLHTGNLLTGQPVLTTAFQLLYTFFFGILMYLSLRVTGTLIAPILLHASTDPAIFMQTQYPAGGALGAVAGLGNIAVIAAGVVLVFFIRGRVSARSGTSGHLTDSAPRP